MKAWSNLKKCLKAFLATFPAKFGLPRAEQSGTENDMGRFSLIGKSQSLHRPEVPLRVLVGL